MMAAVCSCKGDLSSSKVVELLIQTAEESPTRETQSRRSVEALGQECHGKSKSVVNIR